MADTSLHVMNLLGHGRPEHVEQTPCMYTPTVQILGIGLTAYTDGLHTVLPHDLLLCSMQSFTGACSQCGQLGGFQVLDWAISGLYFASYTTCRLVGIHSCCKDVHAALSSAARASSAEAQPLSAGCLAPGSTFSCTAHRGYSTVVSWRGCTLLKAASAPVQTQNKMPAWF